MEKSFVFNSINGDRRYKAEDFREFFASFIGNGVFPNPSTCLQVIANNNMTITIRPGKGWLNGAIYVNTDDYILNVEVADGVLNRIDRIVLRMDTVLRKIYAYIKKGDFATNAVAKTLQRDADAYEIALADVKINKGAIYVIQADIIDLRLNKDLCGIVHGTIDQVDTTTLFNQYQSWFTQKMQEYNSNLESFTGTKKQEFTVWYDTTTSNSQTDILVMEKRFEDEFNLWFNSIKNTLGTDVAGNLLNLINTHNDNRNNPHEVTVEQIGAVSRKDYETQMADLISQDLNKGASKIGINDIGNHFKTTNVEGALNELFTNVSNGKSLVGGAITGVDNSVAVPIDPTFQQLADAIKKVSTGKKWASGITTGGTKSVSFVSFFDDRPELVDSVTVSGLNFTPKYVFLWCMYNYGYYTFVNTDALTDGNRKCNAIHYTNGLKCSKINLVNPAFILSTGFTLPFCDNTLQINWIAIE